VDGSLGDDKSRVKVIILGNLKWSQHVQAIYARLYFLKTTGTCSHSNTRPHELKVGLWCDTDSKADVRRAIKIVRYCRTIFISRLTSA